MHRLERRRVHARRGKWDGRTRLCIDHGEAIGCPIRHRARIDDLGNDHRAVGDAPHGNVHATRLQEVLPIGREREKVRGAGEGLSVDLDRLFGGHIEKHVLRRAGNVFAHEDPIAIARHDVTTHANTRAGFGGRHVILGGDAGEAEIVALNDACTVPIIDAAFDVLFAKRNGACRRCADGAWTTAVHAANGIRDRNRSAGIFDEVRPKLSIGLENASGSHGRARRVNRQILRRCVKLDLEERLSCCRNEMNFDRFHVGRDDDPIRRIHDVWLSIGIVCSAKLIRRGGIRARPNDDPRGSATVEWRLIARIGNLPRADVDSACARRRRARRR